MRLEEELETLPPDGRVTEEFVDGRNARTFHCRYRYEGPRLIISETPEQYR